MHRRSWNEAWYQIFIPSVPHNELLKTEIIIKTVCPYKRGNILQLHNNKISSDVIFKELPYIRLLLWQLKWGTLPQSWKKSCSTANVDEIKTANKDKLSFILIIQSFCWDETVFFCLSAVTKPRGPFCCCDLCGIKELWKFPSLGDVDASILKLSICL